MAGRADARSTPANADEDRHAVGLKTCISCHRSRWLPQPSMAIHHQVWWNCGRGKKRLVESYTIPTWPMVRRSASPTNWTSGMGARRWRVRSEGGNLVLLPPWEFFGLPRWIRRGRRQTRQPNRTRGQSILQASTYPKRNPGCPARPTCRILRGMLWPLAVPWRGRRRTANARHAAVTQIDVGRGSFTGARLNAAGVLMKIGAAGLEAARRRGLHCYRRCNLGALIIRDFCSGPANLFGTKPGSHELRGL